MCTIPSLVKAQTALQRGRAPSTDAATAYAQFYNIPISLDSSVEESTREYYARMKQSAANEEGMTAVREQRQLRQCSSDVGVFLVGFNFSRRRLLLFSTAKESIICEIDMKAANLDVWNVADELMSHTDGVPKLILIPIVESEKERRVIHEPVEAFASLLRGSGLQPATHVDSMELSSSFQSSIALSESMKTATVNPMTGVAAAPLSQSWFVAHWVRLRTLACKAAAEDPLHTMNLRVLPQFDVFVVHLVRAGSRSLNVVLWDPLRRRRWAAKGMLADVLGCLIDVRSTHMTLVPTNRTDRASLFRCRMALQKAGHTCVVVFASEIEPKLRAAFDSDPHRYWSSLLQTSGWTQSDMLFKVYTSTGNTIRSYQRKMLEESKTRQHDIHEQTTSCDDIATPHAVQNWLKIFSHPKRRAAEKAEVRRYSTFVAVSYIPTDHSIYGQSMNPVARQNHVLSSCIMDDKARIVEPWAIYSSRGQFALPSLDDYQVLITFDAKQFLLLMWEDAALQSFLRRGGRIWCVTLAEYLLEAERCLTGQNRPSDIALRYGIQLPAGSRIGVSNSQLPLAFQRQYLLEAAPALRSIFQAQLTRAFEQSQLLSLSHRMDSLLAMTSMEWSGIHIDVAEANRQSTSLRNAAASLDKAIEAYTPAEVPADMKQFFDWQSVHHLHAYFFGGQITIGHGGAVRDCALWTSNLVHLCHRYGPFYQMVGELHLQRYATLCALPTTGVGKLPQRIASFIDQQGTQKLKRYRIVLFDIETTGLNPSSDAIIEIALFDPVENTSFTTLVNPGRPISPRTVAIHNITDDLVKEAPTLDTVAQGVANYLRLDKSSFDAEEVLILVGHNVFGIDEPMLRRSLELHVPDCDMSGVLFCDSLVMLKNLKAELHGSRGAHKIDHYLLEALTTSLRLSHLIQSMRVSAEGQLHRADTDTKALWFVLVNAFGLVGKEPSKQRDALLEVAAKTLLRHPAEGCFLPSERKKTSMKLRLPGVASRRIKNPKLLSSLSSKPFNDQVLEALNANGLPVAGLLLKRQRLDRHTSRFLQLDTVGKLTILHPDQKVHQHIDMTATTTSRTTSAYPSCQNIPKDDKSLVRRLFISRFGAKGRCVEIDYSQLEIVVLAILCEDANLMRDLNAGIDFHVKRAAFFSGISYDEIYEGYRRDIPKYVKLRKTAKQFSFQRLYGAGVSLLHKTTGIPVKDLEASIQKENIEYPGIAAFHRLIRSVALRPNNPALPTSLIAELPTGLRMNFKTRDVVLNLPPLKNYPIQGYGAELAQMMVGRLFRHFLKKNFYQDRAYLINFVHDSVWIDCHVDALQECVRDSCKILSSVHHYVPKVFPGVTIGVPLNVSAVCGVDMCSMQSIKDNNFSFVGAQSRTKPLDVMDYLDLPSDAAQTPETFLVDGSEGATDHVSDTFLMEE